MTPSLWPQLLAHRGARAGLVLIGLVLGLALVGPSFTPDPNATDYANQLAAPSSENWLGTDDAGRDVLSRTVAGTRTSLGAAATVSVLAIVIGMLVGGLAGYLGGIVDAVLSRLVDVLLGLPDLIVALAIVGALGVGHRNLVLALALSGWAPLARIARSLALGSRSRLDVVAARMAGVGRARAFAGHVLPGMAAQVLVVAATGFGTVVLALAGLSFLGLGAQPPSAELGRMLSDSQGDLNSSPWLGIGPGVVIVLTVAAAMLISDALRDALDPSPYTGRMGRRQRAPGPAALVPPPSGAVLEIRRLSVTYPDGTRAVRDVDLTVRSGECLAIVGESGCGKSSLGRAVLRLLPPSATVSGNLWVGGENLLALDERGLRKLRGKVVGYVGQDPFASCNPLHSVRRHVGEAWRAHGERPPEDIAERVGALGVVRAGERLTERPQRWSGGMLQRATIAAATAHRPEVTVADEPTSALDADHGDGVLATLREAGRAVLLISHDLHLVAAHADRVAVMYAGRVVECGPTRDVVERPRHPYTRALLAASPRFGGPLPVPLAGDPPSLRDLGAGCAFVPRCADADPGCSEREPVMAEASGVACWMAEAR